MQMTGISLGMVQNHWILNLYFPVGVVCLKTLISKNRDYTSAFVSHNYCVQRTQWLIGAHFNLIEIDFSLILLPKIKSHQNPKKMQNTPKKSPAARFDPGNCRILINKYESEVLSTSIKRTSQDLAKFDAICHSSLGTPYVYGCASQQWRIIARSFGSDPNQNSAVVTLERTTF
jgi:hypothetical protein